MPGNRKFSKPIIYNGIEFKSELEVKFALLIEDSCEYIYEPISLWYNRTNLELRSKEECPHKYVPDFLVRKLKSNTGHLIEIKPFYQVEEELIQIKKTIAERYILEKKKNWTYHMVTDREIILSPEKQIKFAEIKKTGGAYLAKKRLQKLEKRFTEGFGTYKNKIPFRTKLDLEERDHLIFVRSGLLKQWHDESDLSGDSE